MPDEILKFVSIVRKLPNARPYGGTDRRKKYNGILASYIGADGAEYRKSFFKWIKTAGVDAWPDVPRQGTHNSLKQAEIQEGQNMRTNKSLAESMIDRYLRNEEEDPSAVSEPTGEMGSGTEIDVPQSPAAMSVEADRFYKAHIDQISRGEDMKALVNNYALSIGLDPEGLYAVVTSMLDGMGVNYLKR
jgi:hypothetical protein